jgi:hypothetical protein
MHGSSFWSESVILPSTSPFAMISPFTRHVGVRLLTHPFRFILHFSPWMTSADVPLSLRGKYLPIDWLMAFCWFPQFLCDFHLNVVKFLNVRIRSATTYTAGAFDPCPWGFSTFVFNFKSGNALILL